MEHRNAAFCRLVFLAILTWWLSAAACAAKPERSAATQDCETRRTLYIVIYSWHTSLVINRGDLVKLVEPLSADFDSDEFLEIGWGDRQFYQATDVTVGMALRAILWPTETVLHVVGISTSPQDYFGGGDVFVLSLPEGGYQELLVFVASSFARLDNRALIKLGPALYGSGWFYEAEGKFHAGNTCNTWIAKALAAAGYPFANVNTVSARGVVSQLRRGIEVNRCYEVREARNTEQLKLCTPRAQSWHTPEAVAGRATHCTSAAGRYGKLSITAIMDSL